MNGLHKHTTRSGGFSSKGSLLPAASVVTMVGDVMTN